MINVAQSPTSLWVNLLYLLFQRPLFVMGVVLSILPYLLQTPVFRPITYMMASRVWFPLARLTYGAYLSHGTFMIFRTYNSPKGVFASELDAFLFFFAYLILAFGFSFVVTVAVELPSQRLLDEFCIRSKGNLISRLSSKFLSFTSNAKSSMSDQDLTGSSNDGQDGTDDRLSQRFFVE